MRVDRNAASRHRVASRFHSSWRRVGLGLLGLVLFEPKQKASLNRAKAACCRKPRLPSKTMTITFSRNLAIFVGILTPVAETVRRWHQLGQLSIWPVWLDDFVLGAFLLYGAWRTTKDQRSGQPFRASAWAFTCGMAYPSLLSQLEHLNRPDPAPIASEWVAVIKGAGLALSILALIASLRRLPEAST